MPLEQTIAGIAIGAAMALLVLELLRRKALKERYALLWLVLAAVIIILSIEGTVLKKIADLMGIRYAPTALFLIGLLFVFTILIHISVVLSRQSRSYYLLIQQIAILEEKVRRIEGTEAQDEGPGEETGAGMPDMTGKA
jgi:hypothetical protein